MHHLDKCTCHHSAEQPWKATISVRRRRVRWFTPTTVPSLCQHINSNLFQPASTHTPTHTRTQTCANPRVMSIHGLLRLVVRPKQSICFTSVTAKLSVWWIHFNNKAIYVDILAWKWFFLSSPSEAKAAICFFSVHIYNTMHIIYNITQFSSLPGMINCSRALFFLLWQSISSCTLSLTMWSAWYSLVCKARTALLVHLNLSPLLPLTLSLL